MTMNMVAVVFGFVLAFGLSSVAVAAQRYQPQDDHSGEIPSEVKCSQDVALHWAEIDTDGDGKLDRAEIIASAVTVTPVGHRIDTPTDAGPF